VDEIVARVQAQHIDLNVEHPRPYRKPAFVPMVEAVMNPEPNVMRALVGLGGSVSAMDTFKTTPLQNAARLNPDPAMIAMLIELGADITGAPGDEGLPLHLAVDWNPKPAGVVAALLSAGADIHATDDKGRTALDLAEGRASVPGMTEAIAALKAAGAQRSASLWDVLEHGSMADITAALASKPNLNVRDRNDWTPLMWAVQCGRNGEVVEALIAAGAVVNAADRSGRTALMFVGIDTSVIAPLLAAGLPIDQGDIVGRTALHLAVFNPHAEVISALIAAGADPDAAARDGSTPRTVALELGNQEVLKALEGGRKPQVEAAPGF
jgi:ankyrin repeat protein